MSAALAFVLARFNPLEILAWGVEAFVLAHLVPIAAAIAALLVLVVFGPVRTLAFLRSRVGNIVVALVLAGLAGWYLRALADESIALHARLAAERAAAAEAIDLARAKAAAATALAAEARRQAEAQRAIAEAAAAREAAAAASAQSLQEDVDAYSRELAAATRHSLGARCALSDADARRLRGLGAGAGSRGFR